MAIIGIDLGTTNSLAAYYTGDKAELITNKIGEFMTPSVVGVDDDGKLLVGQLAKERSVTHSIQTARSFKSFMGTKKEFVLGNEKYTATDLSAMVLKKIKEDVEEKLGEPIEEAIVTVPAYFNDNQRSATKKAAMLAGLPVERLINEPSAAALAYRMKNSTEDMSLLVFDFGGGTLDISLVECFDNVIEIIAIVGDNHLGGDDIDRMIAAEFCKQNGLDIETLDVRTLADLYKRSEKAKVGLSNIMETIGVDGNAEVDISIHIEGNNYQMFLSEESLFEICMPIFAKIRALLIKILRDSDYAMGDIADLIMVGGSSNLLVVRRFLKELLHKEPVVIEEADFAVALGAGTYAGIRNRNEEIKDLVLMDVCPFTLGTDIINYGNNNKQRMLPIIERNSSLPTSHTVRLVTTSDYQNKMKINVYQGEEYYAEDNIRLGTIDINIPVKRAGEEGVNVTYVYDINGILQVEVENTKGVKKEILLANRELKEEEKQRITKELEKIKIQPAEQEKNRVLLEQLLYCYEQSVGSKRQYIGHIVQWFEGALNTGRASTIHKATEKLEQWLSAEMEDENELEQYLCILREDFDVNYDGAEEELKE